MTDIAVRINTRHGSPMVGAGLEAQCTTPVTATPAAVTVLAVAYGVGLLIGYAIR
ncbi:hypothetical protein [Leifsonia virtsii]|uniref:Uncharacterized protein n=1 Tax=Leifsonia virtsii TaxID=3035915 RepID=A0ABT8IZN6_9MICO|nr:hypothetical protein [Leifsonia virtsii]MDN4597856.1 hypothetical protein [Leifsonia virtsii]